MARHIYQPEAMVSRIAARFLGRIAGLSRIRILVLFFLFVVTVPSVVCATADSLEEARTAYHQQKYAQALKVLDSLIGSGIGPPGALELRLRTYLNLRQSEKAVLDYFRLAEQQGKDDLALLRELSLGVIAAAIGDMREQMRGAAVTALKEMGGADTVPVLEMALADQSGLVRALAVEGLAQEGHALQSKRLRKLLQDPAALVRVVVLRAYGESGDQKLIPEIEPLLQDEQPRVRAAAGAALVALGRRDAISGVFALL